MSINTRPINGLVERVCPRREYSPKEYTIRLAVVPAGIVTNHMNLDVIK